MRSKTLVSGILLLFIIPIAIVTLDVALTPKPERVIKVLVTSDVHGRIFEERPSGAIGYAKLRGYASRLRSQGNEVFLLDAGDCFTGSEVAAKDKGIGIARLMRLMGYAGMTPGNHDFNYNTPENPLYLSNTLIREMAGEEPSSFAAVACNIRYGDAHAPGISSEARTLYRAPDTARHPLRIAFAGVTTPYAMYTEAPENMQGYDLGVRPADPQDGRDRVDDAATKEHVLALLRDSVSGFRQAGDIVIVLSHLGCEAKYPTHVSGRDVAAMDNAPFRIVIDGHSHKGGNVERINGVLYLNTRAYFRSFAEITVRQYADGRTETSVDKKTASGLRTVPPDPKVAAFIRTL